jgi:hypothetical protein
MANCCVYRIDNLDGDSTGAEVEAAEAAHRAVVEKAYSAAFHRAMDAIVDAIIAGREAAEADSEEKFIGNKKVTRSGKATFLVLRRKLLS